MFYRVAWRSRQCPYWQWKSTTLRSPDAASGYLRLYTAFPRDRLRLFRAASRVELDELLARENVAVARASHVAADGAATTPGWTSSQVSAPDGIRTFPCGATAATPGAVAVLAERRPAEPETAKGGDAALELRRVLLEHGAGGDHDEPYTFTLPITVKQTLAWARLLVRVRSGELAP